MKSRLQVNLKATDELIRMREMPLHPLDREAVEAEIARRSGAPPPESKDQLKLFGGE